jgi:hypothetical protein
MLSTVINLKISYALPSLRAPLNFSIHLSTRLVSDVNIRRKLARLFAAFITKFAKKNRGSSLCNHRRRAAIIVPVDQRNLSTTSAEEATALDECGEEENSKGLCVDLRSSTR